MISFKKILFVVGCLFVTGYAHGSSTPQPVIITPSILVSSVTAAGGQAQVTLSTPTAPSLSAGYYNYITNIHIEYYAASTLTGGATPVTCTTFGLTNSPVIKFPTAEATGVEAVTDIQFANPLQGIQGSQVQITCPGTASVIWNVEVGYFQGN